MTNALSSDEVQQTIAGDGMSQDAAEKNEGEGTVNWDGSRSLMTRQEMLHHLESVEKFHPDEGDLDGLACLEKVRDLHSTGI